MQRRRFIFFLLVLVPLLLDTGCTSSRLTSENFGDVDRGNHREGLSLVLREALDDWMGVPYRLGGVDKSGIDCSALVQTIFADALNVRLPRTTEDLIHEGTAVKRSDLDTGDLVFFNPDGKGRHVGILLSQSQFVHVSSSRGVMVSSLNEGYWRKSYTVGRRILGSNNLKGSY